MMSQDELFHVVKNTLVELFELDPARISLEARFNDDLEIDSIDAVDLIDHLSRRFHHKVDPRDFRAVRTVQDLVDAIRRMQGP